MLEVSQPWHTYQPSLHAGGLFEHSSLMKDSAGSILAERSRTYDLRITNASLLQNEYEHEYKKNISLN
ncbi:hypothetical protein, partial [Escherichia coli]|uniref:hypothetical protein n=1 Tax=Escherichia coli TaxID=562 RepID=UPI003984AB02